MALYDLPPLVVESLLLACSRHAHVRLEGTCAYLLNVSRRQPLHEELWRLHLRDELGAEGSMALAAQLSRAHQLRAALARATAVEELVEGLPTRSDKVLIPGLSKRLTPLRESNRPLVLLMVGDSNGPQMAGVAMWGRPNPASFFSSGFNWSPPVGGTPPFQVDLEELRRSAEGSLIQGSLIVGAPAARMLPIYAGAIIVDPITLRMIQICAWSAPGRIDLSDMGTVVLMTEDHGTAPSFDDNDDEDPISSIDLAVVLEFQRGRDGALELLNAHLDTMTENHEDPEPLLVNLFAGLLSLGR
eukprot:TRINITY_DN76621_c0_g1_i1.p1 TRINITY_DN76621_c0_g1~~TRINITY_DN76621_c0_g1_i1.p1  ORF type:complete len:301 (-),score=6.85 TRINITY_DN76621_c0_g1_i1:130-1032(-)